MNVARPLGHARHKKRTDEERSCGRYMSLLLVAKLRHPQIQELMMFLGPLGGNPLWFLIGDIPAPGKKLPTHQRDKTRAVDTENDGPKLDI